LEAKVIKSLENKHCMNFSNVMVIVPGGEPEQGKLIPQGPEVLKNECFLPLP